jgi:hypothetical protein
MAEYKLDEETRKKLLTRLPFSRTATIEFTPELYLTKVIDAKGKVTSEYEIPEEFRPVFLCRPFSREDKDKLRKFEKAEESQLREIVRGNVVGYRNLWDIGTETLMEFRADAKGGMDKEQFEALPVAVQRDLFVFISGISGLSMSEKAGL